MRSNSIPPTAGTYSPEFFERHRAGARRSAEVIVPLILDRAPSSSVVDVGCGLATWLAVIREHGIDDVLGLDGDYMDRTQLEITADRFRAVDLARPFRLERTFDLAISLEVAEHLPASCVRDFVGSLTALARVVLFSAAIPFQGGENHLNEQWPEYWAALFAEHQYIAVDCLRRRLWRDERVEWWYAQNTIVYVKDTALPGYPLLERDRDSNERTPLALVHPRRYVEWVEWWRDHYDNVPEARGSSWVV
jgi:SAM-dependent methyltransferase